MGNHIFCIIFPFNPINWVIFLDFVIIFMKSQFLCGLGTSYGDPKDDLLCPSRFSVGHENSRKQRSPN